MYFFSHNFSYDSTEESRNKDIIIINTYSILSDMYTYSAVKIFSFFLISSIILILQITSSRHKMQVLNNYFIYYQKK